ncbi:hypothetical protein [Nocardia wallacei]|uniref:Terpene synthase n=1 Tax=Nocardia wallacei TaxID=480035 RepID=A0A7G1KQV4_9NOCA|nr:hypothetical protein [Nocardia wallacei]BCK56269.1 hypothetical protein NWFMUON74_40410 [Nocardia wallacei]
MIAVDWARLIATEFPSADDYASPTQHARFDLYTRVLADTGAWSARYELETLWPAPTLSFHAYLDASSYHAACRTLDPRHQVHAAVLSRYIMWLSAVDVFFDDILLSRLLASGWSQEQQEAYLHAVLWEIAAPLREHYDGSTAQISRLLDVRPPTGIRAIADDRRQLRRLVLCLDDLLRGLPSETTDSGRLLLVTELANALGAQRGELEFALAFARTGTMPDLDSYLALSWNYIRTLLAPSFAVIPGIDEAGSFTAWLPAATACGRAARIANDNGTFIREQEEGKPSSMTITLASLGYPVNVRYTRDSPAFQHALQVQRELLDREITAFLHTLDHTRPLTSPPVQQSYFMLVVSGFYLAAYEHGDFDLGTDRDADAPEGLVS